MGHGGQACIHSSVASTAVIDVLRPLPPRFLPRIYLTAFYLTAFHCCSFPSKPATPN